MLATPRTACGACPGLISSTRCPRRRPPSRPAKPAARRQSSGRVSKKSSLSTWRCLRPKKSNHKSSTSRSSLGLSLPPISLSNLLYTHPLPSSAPSPRHRHHYTLDCSSCAARRCGLRCVATRCHTRVVQMATWPRRPSGEPALAAGKRRDVSPSPFPLRRSVRGAAHGPNPNRSD